MQNSNLLQKSTVTGAREFWRLRSHWLPWTPGRLLAVALVTVAYCLVFVPAYRSAGGMVAAAAFVPAILTGWLLGLSAGLIAGLLLSFVVNPFLLTFVGYPFFLALTGGLGVGQVLIIVSGAGAGWTSELLARWRQTLASMEQQQMEMLRQQQYLAALHNITIGLLSRREVKELLENIVTRAGELIGTGHGYVFWREPGQTSYTMRVGTGVYQGFVGTNAQPGVGLAGTVLQTGEHLVVDDYRAWGQRLRDPSRDILRAVAGVPLKFGGSVVGVIGLAFTQQEHKFGPTEIDILNRFAQLASVALDNADSYDRAHQEIAERKRAQADLVQAQQFLNSVVENLPLMLYAKDARDLRFVRVNRAGEELLGLSRNEMLNKDDRALFPDHADRLRAQDREALDANRLIDIPEDVVQTRHRGLRYLHTRKFPILNEQGEPQYLLGISEDITERRNVDAEMRRLNAYLTALHDTSVALMQHRDTAQLLENIVTRAGNLIGTQNGYVFLQDATGETKMRIGIGVYAAMVGQRMQAGAGLAGRVWETGQPLSVDDYQNWPGRLTSPGREVLRSVVGVPLRSRERVVGIIGLAHTDTTSRFGAAELRVLSQFADLAAIALDNARLFEQTQVALEATRRAAARDARLAAINDRLHAGTDVQGILRVAVQELRSTTGRSRAVVRLGRNPDSPARDSSA